MHNRHIVHIRNKEYMRIQNVQYIGKNIAYMRILNRKPTCVIADVRI